MAELPAISEDAAVRVAHHFDERFSVVVHAFGGGSGVSVFFYKYTATTEIYTSAHTLSLHDALPIYLPSMPGRRRWRERRSGRKPRAARSSPLRSEEHTSELQSRTLISYAVFCL